MRSVVKTLGLGLLLAASGHAAALTINGAGSTFVYPLASKWFYEYNQKTGIEFNYQSVGSGAGIQQLLAGTVDFGASDAYMTNKQLAAAPAPIIHIPATIGAEVIGYNIAGVPGGMKLKPATLADIFLGKITRWNDPALVRLNPSMKLPDEAITVVHRSDGSGTTNIFTDYLSKVSPAWKSKVGSGTSVNWPVGIGAKGNEAVAGQVEQIEGAVGYLEFAYVEQNKITYALVRNRAGRYPDPTIKNVAKAAAGALRHMPADFRVTFTNAPGRDSYPICGFSWILVYKHIKDPAKGKAIVQFLDWAMGPGQKMAPSLFYVPLPPSLTAKIKAKIATISY